MELKEFFYKLLVGTYPDKINTSAFDYWWEQLEQGKIIIQGPLINDVYHFAKEFLAEYSIVRKEP